MMNGYDPRSSSDGRIATPPVTRSARVWALPARLAASPRPGSPGALVSVSLPLSDRRSVRPPLRTARPSALPAPPHCPPLCTARPSGRGSALPDPLHCPPLRTARGAEGYPPAGATPMAHRPAAGHDRPGGRGARGPARRRRGGWLSKAPRPPARRRRAPPSLPGASSDAQADAQSDAQADAQAGRASDGGAAAVAPGAA